MANTDWENYGDVNFIKYGGELIRQDPDYMDRSYNVVQVATSDASPDIPEGRVWAWYYTVDLDDSWYNWDDVCSMTGIQRNAPDKDLVEALVRYYGPVEFQGEGFGKDNAIEISEAELHQHLIELGVQFDG